MKKCAVAGSFAAIAVVLALSGCSSDDTPSGTSGANAAPSAAANAGGDTTFKDFLAKDSSGKDAVIETYLRATGKSTSKAEVATTRASAELFCRTTGKSKLVRNIETG